MDGMNATGDSPARSGPRGPRPWRSKFADAFRGLKLGIRGHSSFFVHFFAAMVVVAAATVLGMDLVRWCLLLACVVGVMIAELFNSAIEVMCRVIEIERLPNGKQPLDIAAGAVLAASISASLIGGLVFASRLAEILSARSEL